MRTKYEKVSFKVKDFEGNPVELQGAFRRKALREGWSPESIINVLKDCPKDSTEKIKDYLSQYCKEDTPRYQLPKKLTPVFVIAKKQTRENELVILCRNGVKAYQSKEEAQEILNQYNDEHPDDTDSHMVKKLWCNSLLINELTAPKS
jgi:hypothetical protein